MKITSLVRGSFLAGVLAALTACLNAQVIELRATLNAAQENPATTSTATGTAIMLYDVRANTFDLMISITGMSNLATASHIHEGVAGVNGPVVTNLGGEAVYTRTGNTLTATFRNITHGGDKLKLIQSGAYYNIHSAQFPGGEIRGQLIARPKRLVANMNVAQEAAAFPATNLSGQNDIGAAILIYDAAANTITIKHSLFNFNNVFTNSHIHEGPPGVSGPVRTQLGTSATAGAYNSNNGHISGNHEAIPYVGDPILLLTGGMYLNYHSQAFANGELRGQIFASEELPSTRLSNLSMRGFVGTGEQVLIQGITVSGPEPVRLLISAKGPSLSAFGVTTALANPRLALHDSAGRLIASNDDIGTVAAGSELAVIPGAPRNSVESALLVVLPPGNYSAIVSAASGTGVALLEVTDLRNFAGTSPTVLVTSIAPPPNYVAKKGALARAAIELCGVAAPLPLAVATR